MLPLIGGSPLTLPYKLTTPRHHLALKMITDFWLKGYLVIYFIQFTLKLKTLPHPVSGLRLNPGTCCSFMLTADSKSQVLHCGMALSMCWTRTLQASVPVKLIFNSVSGANVGTLLMSGSDLLEHIVCSSLIKSVSSSEKTDRPTGSLQT